MDSWAYLNMRGKNWRVESHRTDVNGTNQSELHVLELHVW